MHRRLSAKEELQNITETPETRSMPRLLMIHPPLNFRAATEKNLLDADIGKVHTQRIRDRQDGTFITLCLSRSMVRLSRCAVFITQHATFIITLCLS